MLPTVRNAMPKSYNVRKAPPPDVLPERAIAANGRAPPARGKANAYIIKYEYTPWLKYSYIAPNAAVSRDTSRNLNAVLSDASRCLSVSD